MEIFSLRLYIAGSIPNLTIQSAVDAAARTPRGSVWICADYAGTDSYTNPSNVPIYDNRGQGSITLSAPSSAVTFARPVITGPGATPLNSLNFTLTGWGTGATITSIHGSDAAHYYTITAGTSPSASPSVRLTYSDGPWAVAPVLDAAMIGGTGSFTDIGVASNTVFYVITYLGNVIPGSTYIFRVLATQPVS